MTKVNGTDAKDIAFKFLDLTTDGRNTKAIIARTIISAKNLLSIGYSKEEICDTIDYVVKSGVNMYSFGYINHAIADVVKKLREEETARIAEIEKQKLLEKQNLPQGEVNVDDESRERNRNKAGRFGAESRFREKHHFDMFEGK
jgi:hypothetical protein